MGLRDLTEKKKGILSQKLFWPVWEKNVLVMEENFWNSDQEFAKKIRTICLISETFEIQAWSQEFTNILQSLEPFIRTVKGQLLEQNGFFNFSQEVSQIRTIRTIIIKILKKNWDLETCSKKLEKYRSPFFQKK